MPENEKRKITIKVEDVREWYERERSAGNSLIDPTNSLNVFANVVPNWEQPINDFSRLNREYLIIPVNKPKTPKGGLKIIATRDTAGRIVGNLVLFIADSIYHLRNNGNYSLNNYTGSINYLNALGEYQEGVYLKDGKLSGRSVISQNRPTRQLGLRECHLTTVVSQETVYTGGGHDQVGGTWETRIYTSYYVTCSAAATLIQNNLNFLSGLLGYDINNFNNNNNTGGNSTGGTNATSSNPTYQSSFIDPSVLYSATLPATLLSQDQVSAQYNYYMSEYTLPGRFSEAEFNNLYWNVELFKQVDGFLSVSKSPEFWTIAKEHVDFYNASSRYRTLCNNFGSPKGRQLEFLRLYKNKGQTKENLLDDFEQVVSNTALKSRLDTYLNQQLGDLNAWDNVIEVVSEFKNENYTTDATFVQDVQLYIGLLEESPEFVEFSQSMNTLSGLGTGSPLKGVLVDLLLEAAQEWAENFLGINDLAALRTLLESGIENSERIAFKATRIIARFIAKKNPIFNALSSFVKAREVYNRTSKVYKRLRGLWLNRAFIGIEQKLEKVYESLKKNKLLGKLDVNSDESLSTNSTKDLNVWDDLVRAFGKTPVSDGRSGLKFQVDNFIFNWYPVSDFNGRPAIEILYKHPTRGNESTIIKVRF